MFILNRPDGPLEDVGKEGAGLRLLPDASIQSLNLRSGAESGVDARLNGRGVARSRAQPDSRCINNRMDAFVVNRR